MTLVAIWMYIVGVFIIMLNYHPVTWLGYFTIALWPVSIPCQVIMEYLE